MQKVNKAGVEGTRVRRKALRLICRQTSEEAAEAAGDQGRGRGLAGLSQWHRGGGWRPTGDG